MGEPFRIEGLAGVMKTMRELPVEITAKNGGPIRSSLRKAALVLRDEAKANVQRIIDEPNIDGEASKTTGVLLKSITVKRGKPPAGKRGEAVMVNIKRRQRYPAGRGNVTAVQVGRLLETGTERRQAKPWLRPAFDAKKGQAVQIFTSDINARLARLVKKLERQNGVKS